MATKYEIPWVFRPQQDQIYRGSMLAKNSVLVCHRRFGKTIYGVAKLANAAMSCKLPAPRFHYVAPTRKQAKEIAWDYLKLVANQRPIDKQQGPPMGVLNESELRADFFNGSRIMLHGTDNPDALRGIYSDGIVLDEMAQMPRRLLTEVVTPALMDRNGWRLSIGTPSGHNAFYEAFQLAVAEMRAGNPDYYGAMFRASETGLLRQSVLDEARKQMTPEQYEQEFECSFEAAIQGAYFGKELARADREGRIGNCPIDGSLPVHTAWDLGQADATAIWFYQEIGRAHV